MNKTVIWTAVGAVVIGFGVPAYAAVQTSKPAPSINTVKTTVEDVKGNCDEAEHANDPRCVTVVVPATPANTPVTQATQPSVSVDDSTHTSIDDNGVDATTNSIDDNGVDATTNSVDDNGVDATEDSIDDNGVDATEDSIDDNGVDATVTSIDDSPSTSVDDNSVQGSGADDSGHHNGGDDNGHGGTDG